MHILVATEYLPPFVSGISNRCKNIIAHLRKRGHQVETAAPPQCSPSFAVQSINNPFYEHQQTFVLPPLKLFWALLSSERPFDIVHVVAPLSLAIIPLLPLCYLRGIKVYVSYHVHLEHYKTHYVGNHPLLDALIETLFAFLYFIPLVLFADVVGIPSKTADRYVFTYSRRIHLLKSGLDTSVFLPSRICKESSQETLEKESIHDSSETLTNSNNSINNTNNYNLLPFFAQTSASTDFFIPNIRSFANTPADAPVLIYVGRLAMEKNVEFLIHAMSHPRLSNASLVIVGDGPLRQPLVDLAVATVGHHAVFNAPTAPSDAYPLMPFNPKSAAKTTWNPSNRISQANYKIIFTGMILNEHIVANYYAQSDIFVSASTSETFGFTVAEAMACGTPSVVVRAGAFATVYNCIDAWMFDDGDMDTYVAKINNVFDMGIHARQFARSIAVEKFGVEAAIDDLINTYQWILDGCPENTKTGKKMIQ